VIVHAAGLVRWAGHFLTRTRDKMTMPIPIADFLEACRELLRRELAKLPLSKPTLDVQVGSCGSIKEDTELVLSIFPYQLNANPAIFIKRKDDMAISDDSVWDLSILISALAREDSLQPYEILAAATDLQHNCLPFVVFF
jgi:hypothetical protein